MKLFYSVYLVALIMFCSICSVGFAEVAKPTTSPTTEVRPSVTNEELLQKLLDNMEKEQVDKKDIYDVLLQTKSDKIGILQGNISAILTWGGIVLTLMTVAFTVITIWLNRVFTNKVDIVNQTAEQVKKVYNQTNDLLAEIQVIEGTVNFDVIEIREHLESLEDLTSKLDRMEFEQRATKMRHNLQLTVPFKFTLIN